jgi:branched-chain amino acid transport system permease protein
MSVYENVLVGMRRHNFRGAGWFQLTVGRKTASSDAKYWLEFVGLGKAAARGAAQLPYADQRRLEIARALASRPQVVLLDEPAAGMNPTEKRTLLETILRLRALGATVLLIDHDMGLVMRASDRVAVLDRGKLIALGPPSHVQRDPNVIAAYLGTASPIDSATPVSHEAAPSQKHSVG